MSEDARRIQDFTLPELTRHVLNERIHHLERTLWLEEENKFLAPSHQYKLQELPYGHLETRKEREAVLTGLKMLRANLTTM